MFLRRGRVESGDAKKAMIKRQALRTGRLIRSRGKTDLPGVSSQECLQLEGCVLKGDGGCTRTTMDLIGQ